MKSYSTSHNKQIKKKAPKIIGNHQIYLNWETNNYRQLWKSCRGLTTPNLGHFTNSIPTPSSLIFLEFCKQHKIKGTFLDIGCGNGRNSIAFVKHGYTCTGMDIAPEALEIAARNTTSNNVSLSLVSADFLTISSNSSNSSNLSNVIKPFDIIFDSGCFHHLRQTEWPIYTKQLLKLTKPGSLFFLMCFSTESRYYPGAQNKLQKYSKRKWTLRSKHYSRFFTADEIKNLFKPHFKLLHHYESNLEGTRGLVFHVCYFERK